MFNAGAVAEQVAGQELLAGGDPRQPGALCYWAREARASSAEINFLTACGTRVVPIEVKAGKTGALRSMHLFLEEYGAALGIKTSTQPFDQTMPIVSVPLYALAHLERYIDDLSV